MALRTPLLLALALALAALPLAGCLSGAQNATPVPTASASGAQAREFHVFTSSIDFNETALGVPHDTFTPDTLVVNRGDTVVLHVHNTEDGDEHHTFTMAAPYAVDRDIAPGEVANITFVADHAGIFAYTCGYHQPTMTGQLVVLG